MKPLLLLALFFLLLPSSLLAQASPLPERLAWEVCRHDPAFDRQTPRLMACRPAPAVLDPQGQDLWLRSSLEGPQTDEPLALYLTGTAASQAWLNGQSIGTNGQPGPSQASETPGRYETRFHLIEALWKPQDNQIILHMSAFHTLVPLDRPIADIRIAPYAVPSRAGYLALTFLVTGSLFAAAFGFGVIHSLRRSGSSLALAALAGVAGLQAVLESLRALSAYPYPLHGLRLVGIWGLSAAFALLLVVYVVSRFWPKARPLFIALSLIGLGLSWLAPGFDLKTLLALMIGLGLSAIIAGVATHRRLAGARLMLAYLVSFLGIGALFPTGFVDLSYFLFAAGLLLPLLMAEVIRLGRDDQRREAVLTQAAAQPDHLTIASSRGVERLPLHQIIAITGADDYVEIHLANGQERLHAARLDRLESDLPEGFLRIHRSSIANLAYARGCQRQGGKGLLLMNQGPDLPISRNRLPIVRQRLEGS